MGAMRVTQQIMVDRVLENLNGQTRVLLALQEQLATGLRVNRPSDDPIDARRAINTRSLIEKNEQYLSNITIVGSPAQETATSIETAFEFLQRARELTVQGANGTNAQQQLDAIALEVDQLLEGMVNTSNHLTNNRYIFGGTRTRNVPFVETRNVAGDITAVTYAGNSENVEVAVADDVNIVYNEPGDRVFQSGQDIFQLMIDIRDDLRAGNFDDLENIRLTELDTAGDQLLATLARVGAVQNRLSRVTAEIDDFNFQLEEVLSDTLDADFAEVAVNLNAQSNAYQAALNAAGRVITPSLLDFIR